jgi:hypothetical protein
LGRLAAVFVGFGMFWGAWAVAAADVERALGLSHGGFGLLLSVALAAAAVANAAAGSLSERWGTSSALSAALAAWAALLVVGALMHGAWLAVLLIAVVATGGAVDVVMNVAATAALSDRPGHLVRFHGLFNTGAAMGALGTGWLLHAGATWRWSWLAEAVVAVVLAGRVRGAALPASEQGQAVGWSTGLRVVWREGLAVLAAAFAIGAMVEGGIETWGVLSLRERVGSGIVVGAGAAVVAYLVAALTRGALGPAIGARGAAAGVTVGATLAAGGLVLLAVVGQPVVAAAGLVVAAGGISMCWPLLLAHASGGLARPGPIVGAVSAVGYLGFVVGPSLVGAVAANAGLKAGLLVLAVAAAAVAVAPAVRPRAAQAR